jgi:shikimate dehydrogenase
MTLTGRTRLAGVMGWPVAHSRSPRLHGFWLQAYGIDGAYVPLAVAPDRFETALRGLAALGFRGCNVTLPHKEAALALADEADDVARRIGAANTVVVRDDGSLAVTNTDAFGFIENLKARAPGWPNDRPAVLLGAGGASRAVIVALLDAGVPQIRITNRTLARARALADVFGTCVLPVAWDERAAALEGAGLLVNGTQLGMAGQPPLEIALDALAGDAVVYDLVYVPLQTALLQAAAARHLRCVDGLGMLLHQARPGFAAWFGREPEVTGPLYAYLAEGL